MRGVAFEFKSFEALSLALEAGGDEQELELTDPGGLRDGEWVLAAFTIDEESTAVAACVVDRGDGLRLAFADQDWERLWGFANADGPPTIPPPSLQRPMTDIPVPPNSHILIVDDDRDLQNVVSCMLRGSGFGVDAVSSAEEAFEYLRKRPVDLAVLDWNLPGMTGIEFCQRLRRDPSWSRIPVLFLSAHSSASDVVAAFEAGADDFVSKPFRAPELGARVLGLLRRAHMPPPSNRRGH